MTPQPAEPGPAKTSPFELTLEAMAYGGEAIGRDESGRRVFVPFALPGERVLAEPIEVHASWSRARLIEVVSASPERVQPRCRHFSRCGGCHYQHASYALQLRAKAQIVRENLQRLGGLEDPRVEPTVPSPSPWNTRNHLQFSVTGDARLGFQAAGSRHIVPISECHLPEAGLNALWPKIALDPGLGIERIVLRGGAGDEAMVILQAAGPPDVELGLELAASVIWSSPRGEAVLAGQETLTFDVASRTFQVHASSFFQVHTGLLPVLVAGVMEGMQPRPGDTIVDLYAGVGLFSAFLAEEGAAVIAVESSPAACDDFRHNLDEFDAVSLYQAAVVQVLPVLDERPAGIVVDPPRAGLGEAVIQHIARLGPRRLVYVSCDPATLARDARHLIRLGYRLLRATPIDMFPQTYHIETLSLWERVPG